MLLVPFLRHSTPNNGVPLTSRLGITEDHWKSHRTIRGIWVPIRLTL